MVVISFYVYSYGTYLLFSFSILRLFCCRNIIVHLFHFFSCLLSVFSAVLCLFCWSTEFCFIVYVHYSLHTFKIVLVFTRNFFHVILMNEFLCLWLMWFGEYEYIPLSWLSILLCTCLCTVIAFMFQDNIVSNVKKKRCNLCLFVLILTYGWTSMWKRLCSV